MKTKPFIATLASLPLTAGLIAGATLLSSGAAADVPGPKSLSGAQQTTTTLANAVVAAVISISDATPAGSTAEEIQANSTAVSLLVPECQNAYRLIDASGDPLDMDNLPKGAFEASALLELLGGEPVVQEVVGNQLRTVVPLTNDAHPNCMSCHVNYGTFPPNTVIGAASFRVRL